MFCGICFLTYLCAHRFILETSVFPYILQSPHYWKFDLYSFHPIFHFMSVNSCAFIALHCFVYVRKVWTTIRLISPKVLEYPYQNNERRLLPSFCLLLGYSSHPLSHPQNYLTFVSSNSLLILSSYMKWSRWPTLHSSGICWGFFSLLFLLKVEFNCRRL